MRNTAGRTRSATTPCACPSTRSRDLVLQTPVGEGRWLLHPTVDPARAWLLLGHGAGGGLDAPDLMMLAQRLPERGIAVALFEQPWRREGKKVASRPPVLDQAWLAAVAVPGAPWADLPIVVGGRSAGARVACRTASALGAAGVLNLSFPLHPPGRPEKSRIEELSGTVVPVLTLQGERDTFGGPDEVMTALARAGASAGHTVVPVPGAGHDLRVPKRHPAHPSAAGDLLAAVVAFLVATLDLPEEMCGNNPT